MFSLSLTAANAVLQTIADLADSGATAGRIKIYNGVAPASARVAPSQSVLLAVLTLSDPCGTVAGGVLTFAPITSDGAADAAGTATFFRLTDSDDRVLAQGTVSDAAGSGDLKLGTVDILEGSIVSISSASLSV